MLRGSGFFLSFILAHINILQIHYDLTFLCIIKHQFIVASLLYTNPNKSNVHIGSTGEACVINVPSDVQDLVDRYWYRERVLKLEKKVVCRRSNLRNNSF